MFDAASDIWHCNVQEAETSWHFDIFGYANATSGDALAMLTFHLVKRANFTHHYVMDDVKLCRLLRAVEEGYQRDNPYHNRLQAHLCCMHCD